MPAVSKDLARLLMLKEALDEAIKSQRRSDQCHENYTKRTNVNGFSRALTATYESNAAWNEKALDKDMAALKIAAKALFEKEESEVS
ncbi:hypothetical protein [Veronia pacifica]|uniref:Uncharacterized protein n=1 Tax=Veronia pacifica TaxID=1080227 RepID=A0A1C3E7H9_9GAMM|nr:hypothetical protein [Veronia pacifica]ODA29217.1 hypothetical protein A8L45_22560 [Veronia pacifica]